jgi:hypothetical protein
MLHIIRLFLVYKLLPEILIFHVIHIFHILTGCFGGGGELLYTLKMDLVMDCLAFYREHLISTARHEYVSVSYWYTTNSAYPESFYRCNINYWRIHMKPFPFCLGKQLSFQNQLVLVFRLVHRWHCESYQLFMSSAWMKKRYLVMWYWKVLSYFKINDVMLILKLTLSKPFMSKVILYISIRILLECLAVISFH